MCGLKKFLLGVGLAVFSGIVLAQSTPASPPTDVSIQPPPAPAFPSGTPQPVVDAASYAYLPWIGENEQLLVNYESFFYQLQQSSFTAGSGAYMAAITALVNNQIVTTNTSTLIAATISTALSVQNVLAFGDQNTLNSTAYALTDGTDLEPPGGTTPNDFAFNADNILGATGITDSQLTSAVPVNGSTSTKLDAVNTLVLFLAGGVQPLGGLTFSSDATTRANQLASSDVQSYLLEARTAAAGQSVAFSNLNYLALERVIAKNLGKQAGYTTLPTDGTQTAINDASQLQLEQFMVERRVGNSSWYTAMNTASSITVQRETLFVLAEIEKQLFQQKLLMERMLASQVAIQVQSAQLNKTKLNYDQSQVQQNLSSSS